MHNHHTRRLLLIFRQSIRRRIGLILLLIGTSVGWYCMTMIFYLRIARDDSSILTINTETAKAHILDDWMHCDSYNGTFIYGVTLCALMQMGALYRNHGDNQPKPKLWEAAWQRHVNTITDRIDLAMFAADWPALQRQFKYATHACSAFQLHAVHYKSGLSALHKVNLSTCAQQQASTLAAILVHTLSGLAIYLHIVHRLEGYFWSGRPVDPARTEPLPSSIFNALQGLFAYTVEKAA